MPGSRNRRAKRRYEQLMTPTHFLRISRVRTRIAPGLQWCALRTQDEGALERALQDAGFTALRAVEVGLSRDSGRIRENEKRPAAGYVFAGFGKAVNAIEALWAWQEREMVKRPPAAFQIENRTIEVQDRSAARRPFYDILGPFDGVGLQRFLNRLGGRPYAVL